jgi:hypothetical protein
MNITSILSFHNIPLKKISTCRHQSQVKIIYIANGCRLLEPMGMGLVGEFDATKSATNPVLVQISSTL